MVIVENNNTNNSAKPFHYLSWKCLDKFERASSKKGSCVGDAYLSYATKSVLNDLFSQMREKWSKEIDIAFGSKKTHLKVSGGNYTYYFLLPSVFRAMQKLQPFSPVKLELFEARKAEELALTGSDLVFTAIYVGLIDYKDYVKDLYKHGYVSDRRLLVDKIFFAASKEVLMDYGNDRSEVLAKKDVLFGRYLWVIGTAGYLNSTVPDGREGSIVRVITDLYFYAYILMLHSAGIWSVCSSFPVDKSLVVLQDEAIGTLHRFITKKKNVDSRYSKVLKSRLYRDPAEAEDAKRPNPQRPSGQSGGAREPNL